MYYPEITGCYLTESNDLCYYNRSGGKMISSEYDEYKVYIESISDEELYYESEDTFSQISDEDESIKYSLCVEEQEKRGLAI